MEVDGENPEMADLETKADKRDMKLKLPIIKNLQKPVSTMFTVHLDHEST